MTTTTRRVHAAFPGMSIDQAIEIIRYRADRLQQAPETLPPRNGRGRGIGDFTKAEAQRDLIRDARDCAWCITHADIPIRQLYDAALKGTRDPLRYDLQRSLNLAFMGIDGWLP